MSGFRCRVRMKMCKKHIIVFFSIITIITVCKFSSEASLKYVLANMLWGQHTLNSGNIVFSQDSGFYEDGFKLYIFAPSDEVYYTLDGSDPDKSSLKYDSPIRIEDASTQVNVYSARNDVTAAFLREDVKKYCREKNIIDYQVPNYPVDKCTIIKAVYYDQNGKISDTEERVYFVGFQDKYGYDNVNVISIVSDPENLFGYESGIYVLGKSFEDAVQNGMFEDEHQSLYWSFWEANYRNKGIEWERKSHIQVFSIEKELVLSQDVGIRIQGGGSRGFLPKSLNLYARDSYGENKIQYDFWNTGYQPKRMTLSSGGDDYYTKIKDKLVSELAKDTNIVTMKYEPYILFLNGEYWGFYYLTEKYDVNYIEYYYDVDKGELIDDIIMIKNGLVETGVEADWYVSYKEMQDFIINNDMKDDANYEKACEIIDINSFIDYFAVEGYIARCGDWPNGNYALWRSRNVSDKPFEDGKWRWMLFDVNSTAMEIELIEHDAISAMRAENELFNSLCENDNFKRAFSNRWIELSNTIFERESVNQKISEYIELMDIPMKNHYQRFFGTTNEKFYIEINEIREFFNERRPYILESIRNNFGEEYLGEYQ